jgi:hypothetical protein
MPSLLLHDDVGHPQESNRYATREYGWLEERRAPERAADAQFCAVSG